MKKTIFTILLFAAAFVALWEQSKPQPNKYLMLGAIAVFMLGLMRLMSKVPGRNHENKDDEAKDR